MEIKKWEENGGGQMVRLTHQEALQLIVSLSQQLLNGSCNTGRAEFIDNDGRYFSVSVRPSQQPPHSLDELLARITIDNLHEVDQDPPVGKEML